MATPRGLGATLQKVLIYHDGPQLLWLKSDSNNDVLAVAVDYEDKSNYFFACEVRKNIFEKYKEGTADLRYVFLKAFRGKYFFFDADAFDPLRKSVKMLPASALESWDQKYWPDHGIFSRSHTAPIATDQDAKSTTRQGYNIDGRWEAIDFSRFAAKMADVYVLYAVFEGKWDSLSDRAKDKVSGIIRTKLFQGGGSYLGLYGQLSNNVANDIVQPLKLKEIKYASPGHVTFSGDAQALGDLGASIDSILANYVELHELYKAIRSTLQREKLLKKSPAARFSSEKVRDKIKADTDSLAGRLGLQNHKVIYDASEKNTLVYAKIILSIFRRIDELVSFRDEGRVTPIQDS